LGFIWNVRCHNLSVHRVGVFADNVQIKMQVFRCGYTAADKHTLVVWILFDHSSVEDGFNNMFTLKTFFQGMLHRMALDKIISSPYSFTNDLDVHTKHLFMHRIAGACSFKVILTQRCLILKSSLWFVLGVLTQY
jgi:hypothetical protein